MKYFDARLTDPISFPDIAEIHNRGKIGPLHFVFPLNSTKIALSRNIVPRSCNIPSRHYSCFVQGLKTSNSCPPTNARVLSIFCTDAASTKELERGLIFEADLRQKIEQKRNDSICLCIP